MEIFERSGWNRFFERFSKGSPTVSYFFLSAETFKIDWEAKKCTSKGKAKANQCAASRFSALKSFLSNFPSKILLPQKFYRKSCVKLFPKKAPHRFYHKNCLKSTCKSSKKFENISLIPFYLTSLKYNPIKSKKAHSRTEKNSNINKYKLLE